MQALFYLIHLLTRLAHVHYSRLPWLRWTNLDQIAPMLWVHRLSCWEREREKAEELIGFGLRIFWHTDIFYFSKKLEVIIWNAASINLMEIYHASYIFIAAMCIEHSSITQHLCDFRAELILWSLPPTSFLKLHEIQNKDNRLAYYPHAHKNLKF